MFSQSDILEIFRSISPQKLDTIPALVLTTTGDGFITSKSLVGKFERLVTDHSDRLSVANVSRELGVEFDIVLRLVQSAPQLALLSGEKRMVIPRLIRDSIQQHLHEALSTQLVSKNAFSKTNDVSLESIDALLQSQNDSVILGDVVEINDYLVSKSYKTSLSTALNEQLSRSLQDAEPVELSSQSLQGNPPLWYLQRILQTLLDAGDLASHFYIEEHVDSLRCIPKQAVVLRRDAVVSQLQSDQVSHLDIKPFALQFKELFPSYRDAYEYLETLPSIFLFSDFAVSDKWLSTISAQALSSLQDNDYADCATNIQTELPQAVQDGILEKVVEYVTTNTTDSLHRISSYVFTDSKYASERASVCDFAKAQAAVQWQMIQDSPDKDVKFQLADILSTIPSDQPALRAISQEKGIDVLLTKHFWAEIDKLESQNEADFSTFWIERVLLKMHNYSEGLKAVGDTKLHDQLADLLATYLNKDLLPDNLTKVRSQGLVSSRKSRKNIQKFESTLSASKLDLTGVLSAVEKFGKKQGIQAPEPAALEEAKQSLVQDMVRRMQKPKTDGPLAFLLLIIVLFAKQHPGVVYATGKFAPKLLKQLKSTLNPEQYDQVERWKELAKAGAVTADDKEAMGKMAE